MEDFLAPPDPVFWPADREMSAVETIFRLTSNEDGESKRSVFVGKLDLSKITDNKAALQDLTLLGHYMDYVEACRVSKPPVQPSFGSFPRFFGQKPESARFRQELSSGALSHAFNRIERQFLVTLFHRSYGNNHSNLGMVEMGAGRLRVDVSIKRETASPTQSGLAYGRIGQIILRLQELGANTRGGKAFQAYLDQVLATVTAVSETERRLAEISDARSFLQKQAALSAARELADPSADPEPPIPIGKVIKLPKSKVKRRQRNALGLRQFPRKQQVSVCDLLVSRLGTSHSTEAACRHGDALKLARACAIPTLLRLLQLRQRKQNTMPASPAQLRTSS